MTTLTEVFLTLTEVFLTLTEVFPCFSLSCKANARAKLAKTRHGPHSSTLVVICVVRLFVLFYVFFVCKCVLPPGDNPVAVNNYVILLHIHQGISSAVVVNHICGQLNSKENLNNYNIPVKTQQVISIMLYSNMFRLIRFIIRLSFNHT